MKTKLLSLSLLLMCVGLQAQWSQVGSTQFTNFASDGAITFDSSGTPYLAYVNAAASSKVYVKKFNGTSWVDLSVAEVSSTSGANVAIAIDPLTDEPVVAFRRTANSTMDAYKFNGTSWVTVFSNVSSGASLSNHRLQIQINASGTIRVAGRRTDQRLTIIERNISGTGPNLVENIISNNGDHRYDYNSFDKYFLSQENNFNSSLVGRRSIGSTWDFYATAVGTTCKNVSGIANGSYYATFNNVYNSSNNEIRVYYSNVNLITTFPASNDIVEFRESSIDNKLYLMYADDNEDIIFKSYSTSASTWTNLPSIGLNSSIANFFIKMDTNSIDGDVYVLYLDGGRISVKKYTVSAPLTKYYVNQNVVGGNGSGDSWANAIPELSTAFSLIGSTTTEIWVANGTYKPGTSRLDAFNISNNGFSIYGGFDGTETSINERNLQNNSTILSGDLNDNDAGHGSGTRGDNSYHIMNILQADNVIIDGFKLRFGHANGTSTSAYGGAINIGGQSENLIVRNCEFYQNFGLTGGAIRSYLNVNTSMTFENCVFDDNLSRYGSGMYFLVNANRTVSLDIVNCLFTNNRTYDVNTSSKGYTGSALWARANASGSNLTTTITNCTFVNNLDQGTKAGSERGAIGLGRRTDGNSTHNATINNSIFYYNDQGTSNLTGVSINKGHTALPNTVFVNNSISEDSFSNLSFLTNTSNADPLFTDAANNDFILQSASPAIDAGDNALVPSGITTDLLGNQRIFNTTVDMGAYEFGSTTLGTDDVIIENGLKIYPNPTSSILNIKTNTDLENIAVYNLQGQKVLESTKNTIDVSTMAKGMYVIKVQTASGGVLIKRFIKE